MPKLKLAKAPKLHRPSSRGGAVAFGAGSRAFSDPQSMQAPDQAFGAAMAMPQGGAMPLPTQAPGSEG